MQVEGWELVKVREAVRIGGGKVRDMGTYRPPCCDCGRLFRVEVALEILEKAGRHGNLETRRCKACRAARKVALKGPPGETKEARAKRLNRERYARWYARHRGRNEPAADVSGVPGVGPDGARHRAGVARAVRHRRSYGDTVFMLTYRKICPICGTHSLISVPEATWTKDTPCYRARRDKVRNLGWGCCSSGWRRKAAARARAQHGPLARRGECLVN